MTQEDDEAHPEAIQLHIGNKKEDGEDSGRVSGIIGRRDGCKCKQQKLAFNTLDYINFLMELPPVGFPTPLSVADVLDILQAAKEKLERDVSVPEGVSVAIDELLDAVIRLHIRCKMCSMLNEVALKLLQTLDSERDSLTGEEHRWPHWIVRHAKSSTMQECKPLSFGVVDTIEKIEVDTPLTSVKDRPPTPVPSLTELVEAIFEDPVLTTEEEVMQDFIHERTKIKKTLRKMAKHLYRAIICMPDHILDANKRKFIKRQFSLSSQREDDLDEVVHRLTDAMLSHEDDELMNNEAMNFAIDFLFTDFMQQTYFPENKSREFSKSGREKSKSVTIFPPSHKEK
uniref:Uncharacterized protein n=1 Tax=Timema bartmani TaxID=61472 RepID=A0A7R9EYW3_9NEOP|nr:unnamed protein product [Timema bartmani]